MLENFFKLNHEEKCHKITSQDEFIKLLKESKHISDMIYVPSELSFDVLAKNNDNKSQEETNLFNDIEFVNVSFSQTIIKHVEFKHCKFTECLFINTNIQNSRFVNCHFHDVNTFQIVFQNTFIDPSSFRHSVPKVRMLHLLFHPKADEYSNIGVGLFQSILVNAKSTSQSSFAREAEYYYRVWERRHMLYEFICVNHSISVLAQFLSLWAWSWWGYGIKFKNYFFTSSLLFLIFYIANYYYWPTYQIKEVPLPTWDTVLYYTFYTALSIGSTPLYTITEPGIILAILQGIWGWTILGIGIAMITKKMVG